VKHGFFVAINLEKLDPFDQRFMCCCLKRTLYFMVSSQLRLILEISFAGLGFGAFEGVVDGVFCLEAGGFESCGWARLWNFGAEDRIVLLHMYWLI
jgi:hypothetical protein